MTLDRREFLKVNAAAAAASAAGIALPVAAAPAADDGIRWDKAACRFCGTGCSVLVGTQDGRVVATQGDPESEVNRGLLCVKGYFLSKIMYGADRLKTPLLRKKDGRYDKNGEFTPVSWKEAFDVMAEKWKEALKNGGPTAVGMFGSGQWTIWEGYAAAKLMKGGFRSNNLDPNARHCMASAVAGFMRTYGIDEPMGCYDDFEATDAFVLWGSNMAEMHPVLWTRITDRRLTHPHVKVAVLSTYQHRGHELADLYMLFTPQTDLAILNFIAHHIISTGRVNKDFVAKHVSFALGNDDIGYGLRPEDPREKKAKNAVNTEVMKPIGFDEYAKFVSDYTAERVAKISGVPERQLVELAELYADPKRKVVSLWTMGFNQHTRGTWVNQLCHNIHLLTGKISEPGNHPFSLTGQPSACGTAREVGTFSHRLPADMVVVNPKHREITEGIWKLPAGTDSRQAGLPRRAAEPHAEGRQAERLLGAVHEQHADRRKPDAGDLARLPQSEELRRRERSLPDGHRDGRRPDPAHRDVGGEGGRLRQHRAPHAVLAPAGEGARRGAIRSLAGRRILQALQGGRGLARGTRREEARVPRQDAVPGPVRQRAGQQVFRERDTERLRQRRVARFGLLPAEGPVRGVRRASGAAMRTISRRSRPTTRCAACAGRWSTARKRSGVFARATTRT